jgi:hypothetical protein
LEGLRRKEQIQSRLPKAGDQQKASQRGQKQHTERTEQIIDVKASRDDGAQARQKTADARREHTEKGMLTEQTDGGTAVVHAGRPVLGASVGIFACVVVGFGVPDGGGFVQKSQIPLKGDPTQEQIGAPSAGTAVG